MARQGSSPRPPSISSRPEGGPPVSHAQETQDKRKEKDRGKKKGSPRYAEQLALPCNMGLEGRPDPLFNSFATALTRQLPAHQKRKRKSKKETERIRDEKRGSGFPWTLLFCRSKPC